MHMLQANLRLQQYTLIILLVIAEFHIEEHKAAGYNNANARKTSHRTKEINPNSSIDLYHNQLRLIFPI